MKVSVITPCYLGQYPRAAKDRPQKLLRAIQSVLSQTFADWELIIIADGCEDTRMIVTDYLRSNTHLAGKIRGIHINRNRAWSGYPRNTGIDKATGEIICYLDADDMLAPDHLQYIHDCMTDNPHYSWIWFDDQRPSGNGWITNKCNIKHYGHCGTSNIAHLRNIPVRWPQVATYSHDDYGFIRQLRSLPGGYVGSGGYKVCHVPTEFDV